MRHNAPYIAETYSNTLNDTAKRVTIACKRTLGKHKKESNVFYIETMEAPTVNPHFPRYKPINQFASITYTSSRDYSVLTNKTNGKTRRFLRLGKVPGQIRCYNQSTPLNGVLKVCTIKRKNMGSYFVYYACINYEPNSQQYKTATKGPIGIDIGVSNIVALSNGKRIENDHIFSYLKIKLKKQQQKLNKSSPGTNAYKKIQTRINHLYEKIHNHRQNNIETISSMIVKNYNPIVMEDLSVKQIRKISRSKQMTNGYNDASLGFLRIRIQDKALSAGHEIIFVDPHGTSQTCSVCGKEVKKDISVRIHECPYCNTKMDRDINAARNILLRSGFIPTPWVDQPPKSLG